MGRCPLTLLGTNQHSKSKNLSESNLQVQYHSRVNSKKKKNSQPQNRNTQLHVEKQKYNAG